MQNRRRPGKRRPRRRQAPARRFEFKLQKAQVISGLKWLLKISIAVLLAFVCVWYFGQRVSVIGDSMNKSLKNGDVVLVNRIVYNATRPRRGDIIAFKPKGNDNSHYYVKRIVGLPGETVELVEHQLYINGDKLSTAYWGGKVKDAGELADKVKLGSDEYFVLGDNINNSEDSRSPNIGNVKRQYIYGKVWFVVSPQADFGFVKKEQ